MPSITGTVTSKKSLGKKSLLVIVDEFQDSYSFQVRKSEISKLIEIDNGNEVKVTYRNELSKKHSINNLILKDIKVL